MPESGLSGSWIKSNRCETNACVEVAATGDEILVRNSSDVTGTVLRFSHDEWVAFVGGVRDGDFDFGVARKSTII